MIQVLNISSTCQPFEIRAVFSRYEVIEHLYTRVKGLYQHAYIRYEYEDSVNTFYNQWCCYLEENVVRVLPLLLSDKEQEHRRGFALKLTGLSFGTTGRQVYELIRETRARSVIVPQNPKSYNLLKYAIVYFDNKDVLAKAANFSYNIKGNDLFWLDIEEKACHSCRSSDHLAKDCDKEKPIKNKN